MNVIIIGAGSFGTALSNVLAHNERLAITLLARDRAVADSINTLHINSKYLTNFKLHEIVKATCDDGVLKMADVIFVALPSGIAVDFVLARKQLIKKTSIIVNLAKGFGNESKSIVESLAQDFKNPICSLKGPTFSIELIQDLPCAFTLGCRDPELFQVVSRIFQDTSVQLDFSTDVVGVELSSILKNIYAIVIGIVDAHFNSANVRFMVLTKAFNEMKNILLLLGIQEDILFKYCGLGDMCLTGLNDLSRNRTLGLLIGKGFLSDSDTSGVVLEGKRSLSKIYNKIHAVENVRHNFCLLASLYDFLTNHHDMSIFLQEVLSKNG